MGSDRLLRDWYQGARWLYLLRPLAWLFKLVVRHRRRKFLAHQPDLWRPPVPVIVVGNITLGGTGKSPMVAALVRHLRAQGWRPGIISRGYGGQAEAYPLAVTAASEPTSAGDEPVMLARQCGCPVVVDPVRVNAARYLLDQTDCNIILSDDGLQHYALRRDIELVVLDGRRGLGNGWCLPAGPLREPPERLDAVDLIVSNGALEKPLPGIQPWEMHLQPTSLVALLADVEFPLDHLAGQKVHAVAGIGNPQRFFDTLRTLGLAVIPHAFADHHRYNRDDFAFGDDLPVVMTEKDAVKCRGFVSDRMYALRVEATLDAAFYARLNELLAAHSPVHSDTDRAKV